MRSRALDSLFTRILHPLDDARSRVLRALGPSLAGMFRDRALRTTSLATLAVLVSFVLAVRVPLVLLALGPLVLGVPHLVADIRYLVIRRGLHARGAVVALTLAPLLLAFFVPTLELAGLSTLGAGLAARGSHARRALVVAGGACILALGLCTGRIADVLFAHLHNVLALALWWSIRPRTRGFEALPVLLFLGASIGIAFSSVPAGAFDAFSRVLPLEEMVRTLAPQDAPESALRFVLLFAFAQSVHYALWLRAIPEDARPRRAPRSFVSSYRALCGELGQGALLVALALMVALMLFAIVDLRAARTAYLGLALFHGPLEVALIGLAFAEGRRP